jgi:hypothetical protein
MISSRLSETQEGCARSALPPIAPRRSRGAEADEGGRLLQRSHRFLTTHARAEVETAAERFFSALGYRRRADEDEGLLVFERGRPLASLYAASLRVCHTRVEITLEPGEGTRVAEVRHGVETRGRLVIAEDGDLIEAEGRAFERFLEKAEIDIAALLEAASRARHRASILKIALTVVFVAGNVALLVAYALRRGFF